MRIRLKQRATLLATIAAVSLGVAFGPAVAQSNLPALPKPSDAPAQQQPAVQAPAAPAQPQAVRDPRVAPSGLPIIPGLTPAPAPGQAAPAQAAPAAPTQAAPAAPPASKPAAPVVTAPAAPAPQAQPAPAVGQLYDQVVDRRAAEVYPPDQVQSEWHLLVDPVKPVAAPTPLGLWNQTTIQSRYGNLEPRNESFTRIRIREIEAITKLKAIDTGETVVGGIGNAAAAPLRAVGALFTNPLETLGNIPKGVETFIARTGERWTSDKSKFEDGMFKEVAGVSRKKREIASQMGVDVYSSNPLLQSELDRIGIASAGGNISVDIGTIAIAGPAGAVISNLGRVDALQEIVNTQPASELRRRARHTLEVMAMPKSFTDQFLDHPYYSPRRKTIIAGLLSPLKEVNGRERFMEAALTADSEEAALYYQQLIELISGYHFNTQPVKEIVLAEGFPVAITAKGQAFVAVPTDRLYWTPDTAAYVDRLLAGIPDRQKLTGYVLWTLGDITPLAAQGLAQRRVQAFQRATVNYN